MCCDAREPLAGCTQSEAESNQSLRMMLLRAVAGSATKFGREHGDRVPRSQHWNLEELGSPGDPCPPGRPGPWSDWAIGAGLAHSC